MFQHTEGEQGSQHPAQPLGSSTVSREGDAAGIMISLAWDSLPDLALQAGRQKGGMSGSDTSSISLKKLLTPFPQPYKSHYSRNSSPGVLSAVLENPQSC